MRCIACKRPNAFLKVYPFNWWLCYECAMSAHRQEKTFTYSEDSLFDKTAKDLLVRISRIYRSPSKKERNSLLSKFAPHQQVFVERMFEAHKNKRGKRVRSTFKPLSIKQVESITQENENKGATSSLRNAGMNVRDRNEVRI